MERVRTGDNDAFAELFDRHSGVTLGVLMKLLRRRSVAEEILQETFLQAWEQASRFDPQRGKVRPWILTIARSRALDRIRSATSRTRREQTFHDTEMHFGGFVTEALGTAELEAAEIQQRLESALDTLPKAQSECIRLAFLEGLSHSELAKRLGQPLGTVKSRIRFGLQKLRGEFAAA